MIRRSNMCLTVRLADFYHLVDECGKCRTIGDGIIGGGDFDILEMRGVDSGYKIFQVLDGSLIFKMNESRENDTIIGRWGDSYVIDDGKEMERK